MVSFHLGNSSAAYLSKLRLYQAYEQNDTHKVVNINATRLQEVITYADQVTGAALEPDFENNLIVQSEACIANF